jgi:hypothetical protein
VSSRPNRPSPGYRPQPLRSTKDAVAALLEEGQADGLLAHAAGVAVDRRHGLPATALQPLPVASQSLRQAYRCLGLQADVVPVTLAIEDAAGRSGRTMYGNARPHFTSDTAG